MVNQIEYIKNNPKIIMNDSILFRDVFGTIDLSSLDGEIFYLGIEFGSSAIKYCLYDDNGNPLKIGDKGVFNLVKDKGRLLLDNGYIPTIKLGENQRIVFTTFVSNGHIFKNEDDFQDELNLNTGMLEHTFIKTQVDELTRKLNKTTLGSKVDYKELQTYTDNLFDTTVEAKYEIESANTAIDSYNETKIPDLKIPTIKENDLCIFTGGESTQIKHKDNSFKSLKTENVTITTFNNDININNLYLCSNLAFLIFDFILIVMKKKKITLSFETKNIDAKTKMSGFIYFSKKEFTELLTIMKNAEYEKVEVGNEKIGPKKFDEMAGYNPFISQDILPKIVETMVDSSTIYCFKGLGEKKIGAITGLINELISSNLKKIINDKVKNEDLKTYLLNNIKPGDNIERFIENIISKKDNELLSSFYDTEEKAGIPHYINKLNKEIHRSALFSFKKEKLKQTLKDFLTPTSLGGGYRKTSKSKKRKPSKSKKRKSSKSKNRKTSKKQKRKKSRKN
jgi:hypothetical protein